MKERAGLQVWGNRIRRSEVSVGIGEENQRAARHDVGALVREGT